MLTHCPLAHLQAHSRPCFPARIQQTHPCARSFTTGMHVEVLCSQRLSELSIYNNTAFSKTIQAAQETAHSQKQLHHLYLTSKMNALKMFLGLPSNLAQTEEHCFDVHHGDTKPSAPSDTSISQTKQGPLLQPQPWGPSTPWQDAGTHMAASKGGVARTWALSALHFIYFPRQSRSHLFHRLLLLKHRLMSSLLPYVQLQPAEQSARGLLIPV